MSDQVSAGGVGSPTATPAKARNADYRIALRPDGNGMTDDVVVRDVKMFRAEMMDDGALWMCCYLDDECEQRIDFWISTSTRRSKLLLQTTDVPPGDEFVYENDDDAAACLEWLP